MSYSTSSLEPELESINLEALWLIIKRRFWIGIFVFIVIFLTGFVIASGKKSSYLAEGKILLKRGTTISSFTQVGQDISRIEPLGEKSDPLITEIQIITSIDIIQKTVNYLKAQDNIDISKDELTTKISVKRIADTDILTVSYKDNDPKIATKIVNALISIYLEENLLAQRTEAIAAREFLEQQLPQAQEKVRKAQDSILAFKEQNQIVSITEESSSLIKLMEALQQQISDTQGQISDTNNQFKIIQDQLGLTPEQALTIINLSQSKGVQSTLEQLQQAQSELAIEQTRFTNAHPKIIELQEKVNALEEILDQRIREATGRNIKASLGAIQASNLEQDLIQELVKLNTEKIGLIAKLDTLYRQYNLYKRKGETLSKFDKTLQNLQQQLNDAKSTYDLLLPKLQEAQIAENQRVGNARLVSKAEIPDLPVSSNSIYYIASFMMAMISTGLVIYLLEIVDNSMKTVDQVKRVFDYPLVGVIPHLPKLQTINIDKYMNQYQVNQPYQMLQAKLKFLLSEKLEHQFKSFVISSSVVAEGKSNIVANLALSMLGYGQKILLIDANLNHPSQHQIWQLENNRGLHDVLTDQKSLSESIHSIHSGLDLLTTGITDFNTLLLIQSPKMLDLINKCYQLYDLILIDTPAINESVDAQVLGKMTDGMLLVIGLGVINNHDGKLAKEQLKQFNQNVIGQIVNLPFAHLKT